MTKLLDLEHFAAHLEAATRKAGFTVEKREGSLLWIKLGANTLRCNVTSAYTAYRESPHRLEDVVQAHLSALKKTPALPLPTNKIAAAEALLPLLQQASWLEQKRQNNGPAILHRPFVTGLVVTYVFDFPNHRTYLNQSHMTELLGNQDVTVDQVHADALINLRKVVAQHKVMSVGSLRERLICCETHDGYAATTILLPEMMAEWSKRITGRMLIGIPNRDFIIAFSEQHPSGVETIARQVRRDAAKRQHPLLSRLLAWEDGQLHEYKPLL
ncbi:MAG: DUF1444 family protein [Caldilineaceae bacterium]